MQIPPLRETIALHEAVSAASGSLPGRAWWASS